MQTTVTERGQISIPASLRKKFKLTPGRGVEWLEINEGIFLYPIPDDPIAAFKGKSKGLTKEFLKSRREDLKKEK